MFCYCWQIHFFSVIGHPSSDLLIMGVFRHVHFIYLAHKSVLLKAPVVKSFCRPGNCSGDLPIKSPRLLSYRTERWTKLGECVCVWLLRKIIREWRPILYLNLEDFYRNKVGFIVPDLNAKSYTTDWKKQDVLSWTMKKHVLLSWLEITVLFRSLIINAPCWSCS